MNSRFKLIVAFAVLALMSSARADILVKKGETIGFMGDSITAQGNSPNGYIGLTMYALKTEGIDATAMPAGVPGHTSGNMRARVEPQILSKGANWMTLSCGVNDVMMQAKGHGVDLDTYKANVKAMVEACLAKKVQVVLLTPTPLGEDPASDDNKKLAGYVEFLKSYAKEKNLVVADMNEAFLAYLKTPVGPNEKAGARLLADGIHPNQAGQTLMARTLILALGVPESDLPRIEQAWFENPQGKSVKVGQGTFALISPKQFKALEETGGKKPANAAAIVATLWKKAIDDAAEKDPAKAAEAAQAKIGALVDAYIKEHSPAP